MKPGRSVDDPVKAAEPAHEVRDVAFFRSLLENSRDIVIVISADRRLLYQSPAVKRLLGWEPSELETLIAAEQLLQADDLRMLRASLESLVRRPGGAAQCVIRARHRDGSWRYIDTHLINLLNDPRVGGIVIDGRDVTAAHEAELQRRLSEDRLSMVAQATNDVVWEWDIASNRTEWTQTMRLLFGHDPGGVSEQLDWWTQQLHPEDRERVVAGLMQAVSGSAASWSDEYRFRRAKGEYATVVDRGYIVRDDAGSAVRMIGSIMDITDLRRAEGSAREALEEKERLYREAEAARELAEERERSFRHIVDGASDAIVVASEDLGLVEVNAAACGLFGYSRDELLGLRIPDLLAPEDVAARPLRTAELAAGGRLIIERIAVRKDGTQLPIEISASGGGGRYQAIMRDITARRRAEAGTRRTLQQLSDMTQAALDVAAATDTPRVLAAAARHARSLAGGATATAIVAGDVAGEWIVASGTQHVQTLSPERAAACGTLLQWLDSPRHIASRDDAPGALAALGIRESVPCLLVPLAAPDGRRFGLVSAAASPDTDPEADLAMLHQLAHMTSVAIRNVRLYQSLAAAERRYREMFEDDLTGDFIARSDGILRACNPAYVRIFRFASRPEAMATNLLDLFPDREAGKAALDRVRRRGALHNEELELRTRDGVAVHIVANLMGTFEGGELTAVKGYLLDVTEHKALEQQLLQSQKMEAVGRLAGGIAHDFNNLLTTIRGTAAMIADGAADDSIRRDIAELDRAAERAGDLTRQLLAFSRRQVLAPRRLDPNALIRDTSRMLTRLIGEDIELELALSPDVGHVAADPGQLEQVLMNLVVNARDALPAGGWIVIETARVRLDDSSLVRHGYVVPGEYLMIAVSDNGTGIPPDVQDRIFEPFFTTKEVGKGTGLGLSTVYGIVKQSGGHVWAYSEPDRGTTLKVYLPCVSSGQDGDDEPATSAEPGPQRPATLDVRSDCREVVLLVEDDPAVRNLAARVLERAGFAVVAADGGEEALDIAESLGDHIDIVVTDVVMPRMSGREMVARLHLRRPDLPVLFMSGYTDDAIVRHGVFAHDVEFLQKPFTPDGLTDRVRQVLDRKSERPTP